MKFKLISLVFLLSFGATLKAEKAFSAHEEIDKPVLAGLIKLTQESQDIYKKSGKVCINWLNHSSKFKEALNKIKSEGKDIEIVPHPCLLKLPIITLEKKLETKFKDALVKIDPLGKKVYSADASLVKKALYALVHHHFIVIKKNEKYIIVFGTNCKKQAQEAAKSTQKTLKNFIGKLSYSLKFKLAMLTVR